MDKADSGAPIGDQFTVQLNGDAKTYTILPNVFSDATLEALGRLAKRLRRQERDELLQSMKGLDPEVVKVMSQEIVKTSLDRTVVNYDVALELMQTGDGLATVLQVCCPEVKGNFEEAREVVRWHPNLAELMQAIMSVGQETMDAAGNSVPRKQTKKAVRKSAP